MNRALVPLSLVLLLSAITVASRDEGNEYAVVSMLKQCVTRKKYRVA